MLGFALNFIDISENIPDLVNDLKDNPVKIIQAISLAAYQVYQDLQK